MGDPSVDLDEVDAALLDLDGVVTDTAVVHAAAWADLFDRFLADHVPGAPAFDPERDYLRYVDGKRRGDGIASFLASRGITVPVGEPDDDPTAATVCGLGNGKDAYFHARLRRDGVRVFPGTVAFVRRLRDAGKPVAVVSASRNCREVLATAGLVDLFDLIIDGEAAAELRLAGKPDPASLLLAAQRLGTVPERTALVEDATAGVEAGRRGGFHPVIGIDRHRRLDDLRRAGAHIVISDLSDLTVVNGRAFSTSAWTVVGEGAETTVRERAGDAIVALGDGIIGIRGDIETGVPGRSWLTMAACAFGIGADGGALIRMLPGPSLAALVPAATIEAPAVRRVLDLRSGVLECHVVGDAHGVSTTRFVSLTRPGLVAVRAEGDRDHQWPHDLLAMPRLGASMPLAATHVYRERVLDDGTSWAQTCSDRARVVAVAQRWSGTDSMRSWLDQIVVFATATDVGPTCEVGPASELVTGGEIDLTTLWAQHALSAASEQGFDNLLAEHRRAWADRWDDADIVIEGDDSSQAAIRFALFHLLSCASTTGEAAVGARGLTGFAYAGHVFWDADVFVLPMLAATLPAAAKAMINYRVRRLPSARRAAAASGHAGARFPWESADTGEDVTPVSVRDHEGDVVEILTGSHEEHITTDVAWAALAYADWTGDEAVLDGGAGDLITETARYWASRIRLDDEGHGHIDAVMGPDEYHEVVDDNAFTNIMVRWHLRRAASMIAANDPPEASHWRRLANALIDGYDPASRRHEQFAGFWNLEPLRITEIADVPVAADVLLGRQRVAHAQVLKQPDVLMAHHLVPDELPADSLGADLDFYLPRTAHGSSLSPAICASLLARAGRPDEGIGLFDIAARLDLDDLTNMTAGGLHMATLAGLWHAAVFGFGGVRPVGDILHVAPALPTRWSRLRVRLRFRHVAVRLDLGHDRVAIDTDGPVRIDVYGIAVSGSDELVRDDRGWTRR